MASAVQLRHSGPSSNYHEPPNCRDSDRQHIRFVDWIGNAMGFRDGLIQKLDEYYQHNNPKLCILGLLAMLNSGNGEVGSVPSHLLAPFFVPNTKLDNVSKHKLDHCVSRLEQAHFVEVFGSTRDHTVRLAFRHPLTAKENRDTIVQWLFRVGLGRIFFDKAVQRLRNSPDKEPCHMYRLVDVYHSNVPYPDSNFAELVIDAARYVIPAPVFIF